MIEIRPYGPDYSFFRNGKPYYVQGAGGRGNLELLARSGANSLRIWRMDDAQEILDEAHKLGLTVLAGLRLSPERRGFDYNERQAVKKAIEKTMADVVRFQDHPAILGWCIGNELDLDYTNPAVWNVVNDIALQIKEIDQGHPTMTAITARLDQPLIDHINNDCPALDLLGINVYGSISDLSGQLRELGWDKPYLVTEWGVDGYWEVPRTAWNVPIEPNSNAKAQMYRERYRNNIIIDQNCLGSYAFLWGQKQETTSTWFGLFLDSGEATEAVSTLTELWSAEKISCSPPELEYLTINGQQPSDNIILAPQTMTDAETGFRSTSSTDCNVRWQITAESTDIKAGGDPETCPPTIAGLIIKAEGKSLKFRTPDQPGPYRLFVFITDKNQQAATANCPFLVMP